MFNLEPAILFHLRLYIRNNYPNVQNYELFAADVGLYHIVKTSVLGDKLLGEITIDLDYNAEFKFYEA